MEKIYRDLTNPASLGSVKKLLNASKKLNKKKEDVQKFLASKESYTLFKKNNKKFVRRRYMVSKPGVTISADTAFLLNYSSQNDGVKYLMLFVDLYSRYLTVFPLKSLKEKEVLKVMNTFFSESIYSYRKIFCDMGSEFTSKKIRGVFKKYNVEIYNGHSESKSASVERCIRSLKERLGRLIILKNSERYIDDLQVVVHTYNRTPHRGLKYHIPLEIHLLQDHRKIINFSKILYKKSLKKIRTVYPRVSVGDVVRLKTTSTTLFKFHKSFFIQNTKELFKISKVNENHYPVTYNIKDLEGNEIKGIFYRQELVFTIDSGVYRINISKTRKKNKVKEFLIEYVDFPSSTPKWVSKKELLKIR